MSILESLLAETTDVCERQGLDAAGALASIVNVLGEDEVVAYRVWEDPGFGQEQVKLDVYIVTSGCLHNYCVLADNVVISTHFLESFISLMIASVEDKNSPYVLFTESSAGQKGRIFAGAEELAKLEAFRSQLLNAIRKNRR